MENPASSYLYSPDEALKLDHQLCFPLYAAARKIVGLYTPYLKPLGITYTQYITFMVLWEHDNIPVSEIGARLHLDNGTLTPLLKKMEKQGFITRQRDAADERRVRICLTDSGHALKQQAADIPQKIGSCLTLDPEEMRALYRTLYKILGENKGS